MYEKIELIISEYKLNIITKEKCLIELRNHIEQIIKQVDTKQLTLTDVSYSASDVISKIKHLPESDFSEYGQLKLLRVCGNTLGLYKAVKWMEKHYS